VDELEIQNGCSFPFAVGPPYLATVLNAKQLTYGEEVKKVVDICLDIEVISVCIISYFLCNKNTMFF
jgi:hypothetical protein